MSTSTGRDATSSPARPPRNDRHLVNEEAPAYHIPKQKSGEACPPKEILPKIYRKNRLAKLFLGILPPAKSSENLVGKPPSVAPTTFTTNGQFTLAQRMRSLKDEEAPRRQTEYGRKELGRLTFPEDFPKSFPRFPRFPKSCWPKLKILDFEKVRFRVRSRRVVRIWRRIWSVPWQRFRQIQAPFQLFSSKKCTVPIRIVRFSFCWLKNLLEELMSVQNDFTAIEVAREGVTVEMEHATVVKHPVRWISTSGPTLILHFYGLHSWRSQRWPPSRRLEIQAGKLQSRGPEEFHISLYQESQTLKRIEDDQLVSERDWGSWPKKPTLPKFLLTKLGFVILPPNFFFLGRDAFKWFRFQRSLLKIHDGCSQATVAVRIISTLDLQTIQDLANSSLTNTDLRLLLSTTRVAKTPEEPST